MADLQDLLKLYRLPTGRRLFVHRGMRARAEGHADLLGHIDEAISHDEDTRRLELGWQASREADAPRLAQRLDFEIDAVVGNLHTLIASVAVSPVAALPTKQAQGLLRDLCSPAAH